MSLNHIIQQLDEEIKGENRKDSIEDLENSLKSFIVELSTNENFFNLPLNNIFSVISKVDFDHIENGGGTSELIHNIIKNMLKSHPEEKETLLILQNVNKTFSSYDEIIDILKLIPNCPIHKQLCKLYDEDSILPIRDYEGEIEQKYKEIEEKNREIEQKDKKIAEKDYLIKQKEKEIKQKEKEIQHKEKLIEEQKDKIIEQKDKIIEQKDIVFDQLTNHLSPTKHSNADKFKQEVHLLSSTETTTTSSEDEDKKSPKSPEIPEEIKDHELDIHKACKEGNLEVVQYLIEKKSVNKNKKDTSFNYTPLHTASRHGHLSIVQYLIENQNVDKDIKGEFQRTPLLCACLGGHLQVVEYLIGKGANMDTQDQYGKTPLHYVCENGNTDIVKCLISKGANKNIKNIYDKTPFEISKNDEIRKVLNNSEDK